MLGCIANLFNFKSDRVCSYKDPHFKSFKAKEKALSLSAEKEKIPIQVPFLKVIKSELIGTPIRGKRDPPRIVWYMFTLCRFNICCPRDCVSRHNGGTSGAPLKPLRVDSALSI